MTMTDALYQEVTAITEEYLGPAAERFVARQITFHLNKTPQELAVEDIPKLIEWTKVTLGLLTEDRQMIEDFGNKMSRLQAAHE
ncbi:MAG: hypothetical protein K0S68_725 [Candidatus Saccharibacteria bacterium]|jgi:hypothetical protein|nr:hypothetical protein [Candidatus Saccharibacteria bacterium]